MPLWYSKSEPGPIDLRVEQSEGTHVPPCGAGPALDDVTSSMRGWWLLSALESLEYRALGILTVPCATVGVKVRSNGIAGISNNDHASLLDFSWTLGSYTFVMHGTKPASKDKQGHKEMVLNLKSVAAIMDRSSLGSTPMTS